MSVSFGSDTYGRVKSVNGTAIVTKFFMLNGFPVYPLASFYFVGQSMVESSEIPFLGSIEKIEVNGLPLTRLDRTSVVIAYARGLFAAMTLLGCIALFFVLVNSLTGEQLDDIGTALMHALLSCGSIGLACGLLSYVIPLTSQRERSIRKFCGEILGISADPARVSVGSLSSIERCLSSLISHERSDELRFALIQQLVDCRLKIAVSQDVAEMERLTDEVLTRLKGLGEYVSMRETR